MTTLQQAFIEFDRDMESDGLTDRTRAWYKERMKRILDKHGNESIQGITNSWLRDWIIEVKRTSGLGPVTFHDDVRALHRFFSWAAGRYALSTNPMQGIRRPRLPAPTPKAVSAEDILAMFKAIPNSWLAYRDRAALVFLADTGVRAGGFLNLRIEDLDLKSRKCYVTEKGSKRRVVPFTTLTESLLRQWILRMPPGAIYVFCTRSGEHMKYSGLKMMLKRMAERAGVEGRHNPHSFRHFAAREAIISGIDFSTLAKWLGHTSITTTATFYAIFDDAEVHRAHDLHSPLKSVFKGDDPV